MKSRKSQMRNDLDFERMGREAMSWTSSRLLLFLVITIIVLGNTLTVSAFRKTTKYNLHSAKWSGLDRESCHGQLFQHMAVEESDPRHGSTTQESLAPINEYKRQRNFYQQSYDSRKINIANTILFSGRDKSNGIPTCHHLDVRRLIVDVVQEGRYIPDSKTLTAAMLACKEADEHETAMEIFDLSLKSSGDEERSIHVIEKPDRVMFGIAIACCMVMYNDCVKAEMLFKQCDQNYKLGSSPKFLSEDAALFAAIMFATEKVGAWEKVLFYYKSFKSLPTLRLSTGIINSALRASMKLSQWKLFHEISSNLAIFNQTKLMDNLQANDESNDYSTSSNNTAPQKSLLDCSTMLAAAQIPLDVSTAISKVSANSPGDSTILSTLLNQLIAIERNYYLVDNAKLRRRMIRLITGLQQGPTVIETHTIKPTLTIYGSLIQAAGLQKNASLAFAVFKDCIENKLVPDHRIYRILIEACAEAIDTDLLETAKSLLKKATTSTHLSSVGTIPEAYFFNKRLQENTYLRNGPGLQSAATRKLIAALKTKSNYRINIEALPEKGIRMQVAKAKEILSMHCEKQALTASLMAHGKFTDTINVNLCLCEDCHSYFKYVSETFRATLTCKDPSIVHVFKDGSCSCNEHWGGR